MSVIKKLVIILAVLMMAALIKHRMEHHHQQQLRQEQQQSEKLRQEMLNFQSSLENHIVKNLNTQPYAVETLNIRPIRVSKPSKEIALEALKGIEKGTLATDAFGTILTYALQQMNAIDPTLTVALIDDEQYQSVTVAAMVYNGAVNKLKSVLIINRAGINLDRADTFMLILFSAAYHLSVPVETRIGFENEFLSVFVGLHTMLKLYPEFYPLYVEEALTKTSYSRPYLKQLKDFSAMKALNDVSLGNLDGSRDAEVAGECARMAFSIFKLCDEHTELRDYQKITQTVTRLLNVLRE